MDDRPEIILRGDRKAETLEFSVKGRFAIGAIAFVIVFAAGLRVFGYL